MVYQPVITDVSVAPLTHLCIGQSEACAQEGMRTFAALDSQRHRENELRSSYKVETIAPAVQILTSPGHMSMAERPNTPTTIAAGAKIAHLRHVFMFTTADTWTPRTNESDLFHIGHILRDDARQTAWSATHEELFLHDGRLTARWATVHADDLIAPMMLTSRDMRTGTSLNTHSDRHSIFHIVDFDQSHLIKPASIRKTVRKLLKRVCTREKHSPSSGDKPLEIGIVVADIVDNKTKTVVMSAEDLVRHVIKEFIHGTFALENNRSPTMKTLTTRKTNSELGVPCPVKQIKFLYPRAYNQILQGSAAPTDERVAHIDALARDHVLIGNAVNRARGIIDLRGDTATPEGMFKIARGMTGNSVRVYGFVGDELLEKGMRLHHAVGRGAMPSRPPTLVVAEYRGSDDPKAEWTVLVGKGISFDMGGASIKPTSAMNNMHFDKAGAVVAMNTVYAASKLGLRKNVVAVLAYAQNSINDAAYLPGDVIESKSGLFVDIVNTDAEGRNTMADAIGFAAENYAIGEMITVATLTGAVHTALGEHIAGLMGTSDEMKHTLQACGEYVEESVAPLPLTDEFIEAVVSPGNADLLNSVPRNVGAGSETAAAFLWWFVQKEQIRKWAHLDIAAVAVANARTRMPSGFGIRLLTEYLCRTQT